MRTLVCLSGGLDSALVLAMAKNMRIECEAVGFSYGQPHREELQHAKMIADHYGTTFRIQALPQISLVDSAIFAARNMVLVAHAVAIAQEETFGSVAFGVNASDWNLFPDCRPPFWRLMKEAAQHCYGVRVQTPLLHSSKIEIIEECRKLNVPMHLTFSCNSPVGAYKDVECGKCHACVTRIKAFEYLQQKEEPHE